MTKLSGYIKSAWYNIAQNRVYALFCVMGTALTFIFITIVLQLCLTLTSERPPFVNNERTFVISNELYDSKDNYIGGIDVQSIKALTETVKGCELYYIYNSEWINILINGELRFGIVEFASSGLWSVNQFDFIEGRPYTKQEETDRVPLAVVTESFAKDYYKSGNIVGQEMEFQGNTYKIVGVVADYSDIMALSNGGGTNVWVSYQFNKFIPSCAFSYNINILFENGILQEDMKSSLFDAVNFYFKNRNIDLAKDDFRSKKEASVEQFGGDMLVYGVGIILSLLLIVPAINIITLSNANINNRTCEIAIRRAMGASMASAFWQIITENFILVLIGTLLGVLLTYPFAMFIGGLLFSGTATGNVHIISGVDIAVIFCGVFPLSLLFTLLSGGLPAYFVARRNITELLKGGTR